MQSGANACLTSEPYRRAANLNFNPHPIVANPAVNSERLEAFSSDRYHYSIAYPSDWKVTPAQETLTQGIPHTYDDTVDIFEAPGRSHAGLVEIAALHVAEGTTLDGWTSTTVENWRNGAACEPAARESLRVGSEPATFLLYYPCLAFYIMHVALVHVPSGFEILWFSDPGNEAKDRSMFQLMLGTMTFPK